ncbi:MAG: site-2 protease family protein [Clostridia bacterium]|nr:site-2 protease family protein [Clostridia bacterium]
MLWNFMQMRDVMTPLQLLLMMLSYAVVLFLCLPVHELAHGLVAHWCGDDTAKWYGRLTLNPLKHLDVWGSVMILVAGIGYAKPVPVNSRNFRNYKRDMILVALAGPLSNFLMAVLAVGIFRVSSLFVTNFDTLFWLWYILIGIVASINVSLMVFNLLPIPPLDGSRLWSTLLPGRWAYTLEQYSHYITIGVLLLVFTGVLDGPLNLMQNAVVSLIGTLMGEPDVFNFYALIGLA